MTVRKKFHLKKEVNQLLLYTSLFDITCTDSPTVDLMNLLGINLIDIVLLSVTILLELGILVFSLVTFFLFYYFYLNCYTTRWPVVCFKLCLTLSWSVRWRGSAYAIGKQIYYTKISSFDRSRAWYLTPVCLCQWSVRLWAIAYPIVKSKQHVWLLVYLIHQLHTNKYFTMIGITIISDNSWKPTFFMVFSLDFLICLLLYYSTILTRINPRVQESP